jgi:hypothetical protein
MVSRFLDIRMIRKVSGTAATPFIHRIGKEANRWEEQFHLGADPEAQAEYGMAPEDQDRAIAVIRDAVDRFGQRKLAKAAKTSRNWLASGKSRNIRAVTRPDSSRHDEARKYTCINYPMDGSRTQAVDNLGCWRPSMPFNAPFEDQEADI